MTEIANSIVNTSQNEVETIENGMADVTRNKQGNVVNKRHNYDRILAGDIRFSGIRFEFDELGGLVYLSGAYWNTERHVLSDEDTNEIQRIISEIYNIDDSQNISRAVYGMAFKNKIHPLRDILRDLIGTWDGVERLKDFFPKYLGAERSDYTTAVTTLLFHGAIQRIFNPGCKFDICVVLKGKQGCGKSTLARMLALNDQYFTDDLRTMDTSKFFERIQGKWIVELSEMLVCKRDKTVESLKSTISRQTDRYRIPYAEHTKDWPRQCIFLGTTNNVEFLPDDKTGNRRFAPIICEGEAEVHPVKNEQETRLYIMACYAEALAIGEANGYMLDLPLEFKQIAEAICEQSTPDDPWIGIIQYYLDHKLRSDYACSPLIYDEALNSDGRLGKPKGIDYRRIAEIMNNKIAGWERCQTSQNKWRFEKYGRQRAWRRTGNKGGNKGGNNSGNNDDFMPVDEYTAEHPFE